MFDQIRQAAGAALGFLSDPLIAGGVCVGSAALGLTARLAARRFGWRPVPAVLAGLFLGLVLGVTFSRTTSNHTAQPGVTQVDQGFCYVDGFSLHGANELLNAVLFMPLVLCAVAATHRPVAVFGAAAALSAVIELGQPLLNRGLCETQDFLNNTAGSLIATGVVAGLLALRKRRALSSTSA
ncbi:VanZ family protein [Umezawaea beigongshangensis]|uniref:VanZ family protein n=1 Tax=Umezawaea beigongshangensis TaxID=2780383 RepID=UPI0018F25FBF|nr:VanZ family protein [Umezawaea beigongshangensis]